MKIGPYSLNGSVLLAPMAGVTDRPFRLLCRQLGAALAASEMVGANPMLQHTRKSQLKRNHEGEPSPRVVQIAGADPLQLAQAARFNVAEGAEIIDINMGCPAKKVCRKLAGSALLADEPLVARILEAVVSAVDVPVTLKMRTGPSPDRRNAVQIAKRAEEIGIAALTLHGRTRDQQYRGEAEYDTLKAVRDVVTLPLIGNGDITDPIKARWVLKNIGCDAVMIGRAAQGQPWIFQHIQHFLDTEELLDPPPPELISSWMTQHISGVHALYGTEQGVKVARKHLGWYLQDQPDGQRWRKALMQVECSAEQLKLARQAISAVASVAA